MSAFSECFRFKRQGASQQFIQNHAQRVNVRACIDILFFLVGLFGAHVFWGSNELPLLSEHGFFRQRHTDGLGHPKIDYLGDRLAVLRGDNNIGGLDVPMDDPFLMGMLHSFTDLDKKFQPLFDIEFMRITVFCDRHPLDIFHGEVGAARLRGAGGENIGDIRMVQKRQRLSLRLETGDHLLGVHAGLDDL